MKVKDIMSRPIIAEDEETLVTKIAEDMEELGIGSVVITKDGEPTGIITERDIALKALLKNKRASEVKAREIMTSPLVTIDPGDSVEDAWIVSIRDLLTRKPEYVREFYF
jgi:CBS domain-containing protein